MKRDSVSAYVHMKCDTPLPILDHPPPPPPAPPLHSPSYVQT